LDQFLAGELETSKAVLRDYTYLCLLVMAFA
jgi:hypothetical protein